MSLKEQEIPLKGVNRGMRKVLILGGSGMLGHTLFRYLSKDLGLDVYATIRFARELSGWLPAGSLSKLKDDVNVLNAIA